MYTFICTFDLKGVHFEKVYIVKNKYRFLSRFACTFICSEKNVRFAPFSFPTKNVSALAFFYRYLYFLTFATGKYPSLRSDLSTPASLAWLLIMKKCVFRCATAPFVSLSKSRLRLLSLSSLPVVSDSSSKKYASHSFTPVLRKRKIGRKLRSTSIF